MNGKMVFLVMMAFVLSLSFGSFAFAGDRDNDKDRKEVGDFAKERIFDKRVDFAKERILDKKVFEPRSDREAFFEEDGFDDDFGIFGFRRFFDFDD